MRWVGFVCALAFCGMPVAAQEIDTNWDGPDVPVVKRLPDGGIAYTGQWVARRVLVKDSDIHAIHRSGFPRAVLARDGRLFAVMTQKSLGAIDRIWGGDGHVPAHEGEIEIFNPDVWADEDRTAKLPEDVQLLQSLDDVPLRPGTIDLNAVTQEQGPVALFTDDEIGAINPHDGTWVSQIDDITTTGCPPGVEGAALGMMGGGAAANVTFGKPWWTPGDISTDFAAQTWRPVGANGYFSTPFATGPEAQGSGMSMVVTMGLRARTPDRIDVWGRVNLRLSAALAAIAGGSENCVAVVTGKYQRR